MKFGSQIKNKSVPEWKSYNLDYNHLKFKIRIITEQSASASSSKNNNNELLIKDLYNDFIEQIDLVNLFLNSKIGEIKRRIIYIENTIEHHQDEFLTKPHNHEEFEFDIEQYLYKISSDLQKLSRFIMIQKTALRKLLKKFTKYSNDDGNLNAQINKYMIENNQSFIHIDLTGLYLELALIYDLIRADLKTSISPSNSLNLNSLNKHHQDPSLILNKNEFFNYESIKEGNYLEKFLVHYDNLQELKLFLLANFYFVNQNVSETRQNIELKKQTSTLSLREIIGNHSNNSQDDLSMTPAKEEPSKHISNSIYLNETDNLIDDSITTGLILEDPKQYQSIKSELEPGMFLTNLNNEKRTILLSAIGGLRKISCVLIDDLEFLSNLLDSCLSGDSFEKFYELNESKLVGLSSLEKISIEWIYSKNVKPLIKLKFNETNFTNLNAMKTIYKDSNFKCWINLKSNINISDLDLDQTQWTENNSANSLNFPYALLEVRWNLPNKSHTVLDKLFESHLIYNIDKDFNFLIYSNFKFNKLNFKPNWSKIFDNQVDIRKSPPNLRSKKSKSKQKEQAMNATNATVNGNGNESGSSVSGESTVQFRYWNEFDNGSDFENQDAGFLIDINSENESGVWGSNSIDWFYKISNNFNNFIIHKLPWLINQSDDNNTSSNQEYQRLIKSQQEHDYGVFESDVESLNEALKSYQQTTFLSSLSLLTSLISLMLTAVSLGITTSIFHNYDDVDLSPVIIGILSITMILSLFLGILSICLIMSCDSKPLFNLIFSWCVFIGVTIFIIGGIGSIFGI